VESLCDGVVRFGAQYASHEVTAIRCGVAADAASRKATAALNDPRPAAERTVQVNTHPLCEPVRSDRSAGVLPRQYE